MDLNQLLIFVIISFLKYLTLCRGQVIQFGRCSDVSTQKYFRLDKFIGHWYEIQRFPAWYEDHSHCASKFIVSCDRKIEIQHIYIKNNIRYILHVNSSYHAGDDAVFYINETNIGTTFSKKPYSGNVKKFPRLHTKLGDHVIHFVWRRGNFFTFPEYGFLEKVVPNNPVGIPLSVIGTDYQNYALIYGCRYNKEINIRYMSSWILSRNRTLEESYINTAYSQLSSISAANIVYFESVEQDPDKCRYDWTAHVHAEDITTNVDKANKST